MGGSSIATALGVKLPRRLFPWVVALNLVFVTCARARLADDQAPVSSIKANMIKMGEGVFAQNCSVGYCHGKEGRAGRGPRLRGRNLQMDFVVGAILDGIPNTTMKGWRGRLTTDEIRSVVTYIATFADLTPGNIETLLPEEMPNHSPSPSSDGWAGEGDGRQQTISIPRRSSPVFGDPARGKELFFRVGERMNCAGCHTINGRGGRLGPDLSGTSTKTARALLEDIVLPNEIVADDGRLHEITTLNGDRFEAIPVGETSTRVTVFDASSFPPVRRSLKKDIIQNMSPTDRSAMPATYSERYTIKELLDLIAFLKSAESATSAPVNLADLF